jgi:hypothetical protein
LSTALAFFRRDAKIALSYPLGFWLSWVSIMISVAGFHFVSQLVAPSAKLGANGHVSSYFTYVVVNVAFTVLLSCALQCFADIIRRDQLSGTLEPLLVGAPRVPNVMVASGCSSLFISALQVALYIATALFFGLRLDHANLLTIIVFALLGVACMGALGLMAAAAVIAYKQQPPSNFLIAEPPQCSRGCSSRRPSCRGPYGSSLGVYRSHTPSPGCAEALRAWDCARWRPMRSGLRLQPQSACRYPS